MKNPFKDFTIASTGDFGKQRTADAIKRWVENNGGRYVTKVDEEVTHLVCSAECWKSQSVAGEFSFTSYFQPEKSSGVHSELVWELSGFLFGSSFGVCLEICRNYLLTKCAVQAAKRYPKKIKIVTYDWLEDSLMGQTRKREGEYLIKKHVKADRKRKNDAKSEERSALKMEGELFLSSFNSLISLSFAFETSRLISV